MRNNPTQDPQDPQLTAITRHATELTLARDNRNRAIRQARAGGHTWRAIALAAGMTEHGVRLAARTDSDSPDL